MVPRSQHRPFLSVAGLDIALALWLAILVGGISATARWEGQPGEAGEAPATWPADASVSLTPGSWTLILFAHPRCPCTRSSLHELERIVSRSDAPLSAHVLFCIPEGAPPGWERSALWSLARGIPRLQVRPDAGGLAARRFGARTSGDVLLYDPSRELRFHGGITLLRGHQGASPGTADVLALLRGRRAGRCSRPVFGCGLFDEVAVAEEQRS
jgi:hypothetical protein